MTKKQLYLTSLFVILAFTAFEELWLRPYLFKTHRLAFGIAGSLPNFLAPIILLSSSLALAPHRSQRLLATTVAFVAGLVVYELAQPYIEGRTFDINDIIASVLGGVVGYAWALAISKVGNRQAEAGNL